MKVSLFQLKSTGWLTALLWLAMSQVSLAAGPFCTTPQAATVNSGGSVTFDVSNCDGPDNFGMADPGVPPSHGSYVLTGQLDGAGTERVTYTNNGDGATSDSFYIEDNESPANKIVFNITINPSRTASITVSPSSANEDSGTAFVYTVTLSATSSTPTTVNLTRSGTATVGTDYSGAVSSVTVPANVTSASFPITPVADTTVEPDETVIYQVASGSGYSIGSPSSATATIVNDDAYPTLSIGDVSVAEGNSGTTTATFPVTLSAASSQTVTVNYATANGSANAGSDYVARSGTLTFSPGTTTQNVAVTVNGDTTVEPDETFTVTLSGASNATIARATATGTILNDDATVTVAPASLPAATAGAAYSQTMLASGGTAPYNFSVTSGSLPPGLVLSSAGVLSGTPTASGSFNFQISATDSGTPNSGSRSYTLTVAAPTLTLPATTLTSGTAGQAYSAAITPASGGIAPYAYTMSAGALPAGISLNSASGTLSGTPTAVGNFSFTLTATDSTSGTPGQASRSYTLATVAPTLTITPSTLPAGIAGSAYSQTLSASGGTAPYSFAVFAGALPAGLNLNSAGVLSGTPTASGSFNFTVSVTDAGGFGATQAYTLAIASPTLTITPSTLPAGIAGSAYSQTLSASGGTAPYSFAVSAGALPAGLTLNSAGVLSGTPTASGSFNFTVSVTDTGGFGATQAYTLAIASPTLTITPSTLPAGIAGSAYSQTLSASGGTAPYSFVVSAGALPAGISLNPSTGAITGTPSASGSYNFTIEATDANNAAGTAQYALTIGVQAPVANPVTSTIAANSHANLITLNITGGPVASVAVASNPSHGTASVSGTSIAYTPAAGYSGIDSFTYTATNPAGTSAAATVTVTVTPPNFAFTPAAGTLPTGPVGTVYRQTVSATGGTAPYVYETSAGA
uniref:beta strand repeat-containing protein n=1 Tax=Oryzifoliimicrobium ureilyticus TaxID=3113724 RepID=UPI00307636EA